jgi:hypothetical protein
MALQPDQHGSADTIARREHWRGRAGVKDGYDRHRLEADRRGTTFEDELRWAGVAEDRVAALCSEEAA